MQEFMKGIVIDSDGSVVFRTDLPIPEIGPRDVLVKVAAAAICGTDRHIYSWTKWAQDRIPAPMVFGHEFAGEIVKVGTEVTEFQVGARVAGETHIPCNDCHMCKSDRRHNCSNMKIIGVHTPGCFSDYISIPVDCLFAISDDLSYEDASMLEPMGVAVHGVSAGEVKDSVTVIYGAGPIGMMAVGAAKANGAKKIICIDGFDDKLTVASQMGADLVINARNSDPVKTVFDYTDGIGADIVIDFTGNQHALTAGFEMLRKNGRFVIVGLPSTDITLNFTDAIIYKEATVLGVTGRLMYQTWDECIDILHSDSFSLKPVVGGIYKLENYKDAFDAIEAGAPGKMLLIP